MEKELAKIPFSKPARIGNFKIWRSRISLEFMPTRDMLSEEDQIRLDKGQIKLSKQKEDIEAINISNLEGTWMIRIPETYEMFIMLMQSYGWYMSDNEEAKKRGEDYLTTVFSNMLWVSNITNGYYHEGVFMVGGAYADPTLLSDKKKFKSFKDTADRVIKDYLSWRKTFDKVTQKELSKEELKKDEQVQEIMDQIEKGNGTAES